MRNASALELAWAAIAVVGVLLSFWMIADGWLDLRVVRRAIRGGYARARGARWWIAVGAVVSNSLFLLGWLGFLAVGLVAMQFPPPPPNPAQQTSNAWAGWLLIAMEAVFAAAQVWARVVRQYVVGRPHVPTPGSQP